MSNPEKDIHLMQTRALEIADKYRQLNSEQGFGAWGAREYAEGFMGDAGMLMKLVMAQSGLRRIEDIDKKLKHEIGDCVWSLLVLSRKLGIDPADAFWATMDELEDRFRQGTA